MQRIFCNKLQRWGFRTESWWKWTFVCKINKFDKVTTFWRLSTSLRSRSHVWVEEPLTVHMCSGSTSKKLHFPPFTQKSHFRKVAPREPFSKNLHFQTKTYNRTKVLRFRLEELESCGFVVYVSYSHESFCHVSRVIKEFHHSIHANGVWRLKTHRRVMWMFHLTGRNSQ